MNRIEKIRERLVADPGDVFLNYSYAMELSKAGASGEMRSAFAKVRELDPHYVAAYFQEGQILAAAGNVEEARHILQEGIAVALKVEDDHAVAEMTEFLNGLVERSE